MCHSFGSWSDGKEWDMAESVGDETPIESKVMISRSELRQAAAVALNWAMRGPRQDNYGLEAKERLRIVSDAQTKLIRELFPSGE
jgi:hypothetical protein